MRAGRFTIGTPALSWRRFTQVIALLLTMIAWPTGGLRAAEPQRVEVGVWFSGLHSINVPDSSFGAEFFVWWISADPDFRPFDSLQILNGRQWTSRSVNRRKLSDGRYYTSGFISVTATHNWDLYYFPFDSQKLRIILETSATASELRFAPNRKASTVSNFLRLEGFKILSVDLSERVEQYRTNFGIAGSSNDKFSRVTITLSLERHGDRIIMSLLIGFIVANVICLLTYLIDVSSIAIRVAMIGGAIFAAVGNMYLLNTALNPAVGSLLVDRFAVGSFSAIVLALLTAILAERFNGAGKVAIAHRANRIVLFCALAGSAVFYALALYSATSGS